jgi:hypothetical protein
MCCVLCRAHPWYQVNLPEYLKYTPVKITLAREEDIEEDVLQEILTVTFRPRIIATLNTFFDASECACVVSRVALCVVCRVEQKFEMTREAAIPLLLEASLEEDAGSSPQGNDILVAYHLIHDARRMYEYKGGPTFPIHHPIVASFPAPRYSSLLLFLLLQQRLLPETMRRYAMKHPLPHSIDMTNARHDTTNDTTRNTTTGGLGCVHAANAFRRGALLSSAIAVAVCQCGRGGRLAHGPDLAAAGAGRQRREGQAAREQPQGG